MEEIGNLIYTRRRELGLTLEDVGKACGVGKSTVRKWEQGMIKDIGRSKLAALAKILQIDPTALIRPEWTLDLQLFGKQETEEVREELSEEQRVLFRLAKNAKPEALRAAAAVLKSMEETNDEF